MKTLPIFPLISEKPSGEVMPSRLVARYREYIGLREKIDYDKTMMEEKKYRLGEDHPSKNYLYISNIVSIGNVIWESW